MKRSAAGAAIRIHPLSLMLPALAAMLNPGPEIPALLTGLALHEAAHLFCARLLNIRVEELRLMPFGGAARLGNLYALTSGRLFTVAAAGPAANLLAVFLAAALAHWRTLSPAFALALIRTNLTLLLFNLLPALPLDGGRMLYALSAPRLGRQRAANLGICLGRALAVALIAGMLYGWYLTRRFNLSMLFAAVFLLSSADREREALTDTRVSSLLNAARPVHKPVPMRLCAVGAAYGANAALRHARPDAATLYAVYEGDRLAGFADERSLLALALDDPDAPVGRALKSPAARGSRSTAAV